MINQEQIINRTTTLIEALDIMDKIDKKLLIICRGLYFEGVISIGDIQRALLGKKDLTRPVIDYVRSDITISSIDDDQKYIKEMMKKQKIESMPVIDHENRLIDVISWSDLFVEEGRGRKALIDFPVVIMAGGKGTRLRPLTNIIPKPLVPISDRTIIEDIMCSFREIGCNEFYISVNYKKEMIEGYFMDKDEWNIEFVHEKEPLGTAGALGFLKDKIKSTFFLINCDTLVDLDITDVIEFHEKNKNAVTLVSVVKKMSIPYGTIETDIGGVVKEIKEKPEYVYQINSGMYILEPIVFNYIERDTFANITDVIDQMITSGQKVGAFPIPGSAWVDMGNWMEYLKLVDKYSSEE